MRLKNRLIAGLCAFTLMTASLAGCGQGNEVSRESTAANQSSEAVSSGEETAASSQSAYAIGTVTSRVNFRAAADSSSESYGILEAGTEVEVVTKGDVWCEVLYDGKSGYIASQYLSVTGSTDIMPSSSAASTEPASSSSAAASSEPASSSVASSSAASTGGVPTITRNTTVWDPATLPNKSIPYGNDWEVKNDLGVATGVYYYSNLYSKYNAIYHVETTDKIIYLTMDEGYEAGYTPTILDTLKEKGVKATFFLTKQFFDSDPELIQRMIDEGHVLGNHTCLHPSGGYPLYVDTHGLQTFVDDVNRMHDLVYDKFGYDMKLFRFPEGEASEQTMAQLSNMGYYSVFWSYTHRDFVLDDQPDPAVTLERCISHLAPGNIYLLHAVSSSNTAALGDFIDQARALGYEFALLPVE